MYCTRTLFQYMVILILLSFTNDAKSAGPGSMPDEIMSFRDLKYDMFNHYSLSTFDALEQTPGSTAPASVYNPTGLNIDQFLNVPSNREGKIPSASAQRLYNIEPSGVEVTANSGTIKICPLGNSITQSDNSHVSYRYPLWKKLIDGGVAFDFVGTLNTNHGGDPSWPEYNGLAFDRDHEGHWGWRANEIRDNIEGWLAEYTPDMVLIHIGTNDIYHDQQAATGIQSEITQIIEHIRGDNPNVVIFLASLIPCKSGQSLIDDLNTKMPGYIETINTNESPVIFVDMASVVTLQDLFDGIHPGPTGEEKMAQKWFDAINTYLFGSGTEPVTGVAVSPTTATVTVGTSAQLTATVSPSNAANKTVSWSSSNPSVASVNSIGFVTGVAQGTATITVTTEEGNFTATANITVGAGPLDGYSYCSNENQTCTFSGTVDVAYGANGQYNFLYGLTGGSVSCNNSTFGDPISGVVKACYVKQVGTTTTYALSTSTNGQGSINPSSGTYEEGTSVSLTATPASGWQFDSWSGDASGSGNPVSIAMDGNKSVTANFSEIPVNCAPTALTSNIQVNGGSWVQSTSATVSVGDAVKFGPHPTTGGSWSWSGPNGYSASSREIELTNLQTSQAGTYTATFTNDCGTQSALSVMLTVQSGGTTATATIQENETGFCSVDGSVDNNNAGFTGTGFANTDNAYGNGITWSVDIPAAGTYSFVWRYANGGSTDRTAQLMEDGSTIVSNVSMPSTGSWTSWAETPAISANLSAGTKLIRLQATNPSGLSNVDYMVISGGSLSAVACTGLKNISTANEIADNDKGITFYPVPVDDLLNIQFNREFMETVDIYLYDMTGKTVRSGKAKGLSHTLDMSGLPIGLYTVRISGENLNVTERVVKQ